MTLPERRIDSRSPSSAWGYVGAALACALTAGAVFPVHERIELPNIVMLFVMTVVLVAVKAGGGPAVMASLVSVVLFDFLFVPPRFSLAVSHAQYLVTFAVMLAVSLLVGHLTAGLRAQAKRLAYDLFRLLYRPLRKANWSWLRSGAAARWPPPMACVLSYLCVPYMPALTRSISVPAGASPGTT